MIIKIDGQIMLKKLLELFLLLSTFALADDIGSLMNDYIKASENSIKTKDENAGNLIVYTRDDLERMQALTLKDILKTLRYFSYSENRVLQSDLINLDAFSNNSKGIRLYLNDHELLSTLYGSGFVYFGDMELEFIDHVEIYTGFPSFEFGIEPAMVVIRLYTKDAKHDEGGKVKLLGGSNTSHLASAYYSDKFDDFTYFTYLGQYNNQREGLEDHQSSLQRNQLRDRFYGSMGTENHILEVHATQTTSDAFLGNFPNSQIIDNEISHQYLSISERSYFMDKTLTFKALFATIDSQKNEHINLPDINVSNILTQDNRVENSFTLSLQKDWSTQNNNISLGLQYRYKDFDITDNYFDGHRSSYVQPYTIEQIYSLYLEDQYSLTDNSLLSLSLMNQFYLRNGDVNAPDNLQLRAAYIYDNNALSAKTTLSRQSFATEPYLIVAPGDQGNSNLKSEDYISLAQELTYRSENTLNNVLLSYAQVKDFPLLNPDGRPQNSDKTLEIITATYEFTYFYSLKDKFEFHLNYSLSDNAYETLNEDDKAQIVSSLFRSVNTFGDWDIFNEFWIVSSAFTSEISVDYSAAVKYRISNDFSLHFKGENLFDNAQKSTYIDKTDPITGEVQSVVNISVIDRKLWLGLEYLF